MRSKEMIILAQMVLDELVHRETIITRSGEFIYNLNLERVIELNIQMLKIEEFIQNGIGDPEKEKAFREEFKEIIEKFEKRE